MPLTPIYMAPGVCMTAANYSLGKPFNFVEGRYATGRYVDMQLVRFTAGFPEKIGGWIAAITSGLVGITRCLRTWRDYTQNVQMCIGTESHLYTWNGTTLTDITPLRYITNATLGSNPLTTANGSAEVAVADSSQVLANGDWVFISASTVHGITLDGYYIVSGVTGTGYNVNAGTPATGSGSGGGTVTVQYPRKSLSGPFTTSNGSAVVSVQDNAHGATTGDYVTYAGATAVGGLTIAGQYQLTVVDANHYTITAASPATSGATGGGTPTVAYNVSMGTFTITAPVAYGTGPYGVGPYGYSSTTTTMFYPGWTIWPYGNLILANNIGGTIYVYDFSQGGVAYPLLNAPTDVLAMLVTPERFIIALGTASSSLQVAWPDQNSPTNWTSSPINTANSGRTLQGGSYFVGGCPVSDGNSLILTDRSCFQLNYTGDTEVYNSPLVSDNAGLIGPNAIVAEGEVAYWMSDKEFWMWNGTVTPMPSDDIREFVFTNLNSLQKSKCCAGFNRIKKEVWFFYVSNSAVEVDSYVIYHTDQQCWSKGMLSRTAWLDSTLFSNPYASDALGNIFQHESGVDANGQAMDAYIQTAPIDISNGDTNMDVMGFIPDIAYQTGDLNLSVLTRYYPNDEDNIDGPYALSDDDTTPRQDLRSDGKMVAIKLESNVVGGDFRLGLFRLDIQPSGARR